MPLPWLSSRVARMVSKAKVSLSRSSSSAAKPRRRRCSFLGRVNVQRGRTRRQGCKGAHPSAGPSAGKERPRRRRCSFFGIGARRVRPSVKSKRGVGGFIVFASFWEGAVPHPSPSSTLSLRARSPRSARPAASRNKARTLSEIVGKITDTLQSIHPLGLAIDAKDATVACYRAALTEDASCGIRANSAQADAVLDTLIHPDYKFAHFLDHSPACSSPTPSRASLQLEILPFVA
jgi:hypothetical protein